MQKDAALAVLPVAQDLGAFAYIGVPVLRADGSSFGTLVGLDPTLQQRLDEPIRWMQILAQLAAAQGRATGKVSESARERSPDALRVITPGPRGSWLPVEPKPDERRGRAAPPRGWVA
jgi:hypothetical protein